SGPWLRKGGKRRAGKVHGSENAESRAQERPIARKMQKLTRRSGPPLGKCRISRAGEVHHSGNAGSHALERSLARELQNSTRWRGPLLRKCRISRAGTIQRPKIAYFRALALLSYFKNLIYVHSPQKNPLKKSYLIKSSFFRGKELKFVFIEEE